MHWTTTKPTEPGWYWYQSSTAINGNKFPRICEIISRKQILYVEGMAPSYFLLENASGEWSSTPVPRPEEG